MPSSQFTWSWSAYIIHTVIWKCYIVLNEEWSMFKMHSFYIQRTQINFGHSYHYASIRWQHRAPALSPGPPIDHLCHHKPRAHQPTELLPLSYGSNCAWATECSQLDKFLKYCNDAHIYVIYVYVYIYMYWLQLYNTWQWDRASFHYLLIITLLYIFCQVKECKLSPGKQNMMQLFFFFFFFFFLGGGVVHAVRACSSTAILRNISKYHR